MNSTRKFSYKNMFALAALGVVSTEAAFANDAPIVSPAPVAPSATDAYIAAGSHIVSGTIAGIAGGITIFASPAASTVAPGFGTVYAVSVGSMGLAYGFTDVMIGTTALGLAAAGNYKASLDLSNQSETALEVAANATTSGLGALTAIVGSTLTQNGDNLQTAINTAASIEALYTTPTEFAGTLDGFLTAKDFEKIIIGGDQGTKILTATETILKLGLSDSSNTIHRPVPPPEDRPNDTPKPNDSTSSSNTNNTGSDPYHAPPVPTSPVDNSFDIADILPIQGLDPEPEPPTPAQPQDDPVDPPDPETRPVETPTDDDNQGAGIPWGKYDPNADPDYGKTLKAPPILNLPNVDPDADPNQGKTVAATPILNLPNIDPGADPDYGKTLKAQPILNLPNVDPDADPNYGKTIGNPRLPGLIMS